ncbi:MAG: SCP2 sterol-binding domain-containing protein [Gammaproteobacteria bacterium]|nr:SCP2 sterol-binding domain-containing protein [Gammaproteobacteria bacterium]
MQQDDSAKDCPRLPDSIGEVVSRLPGAPLRVISERVVRHVLAEAIAGGDLVELENREVAICVDDLGIRLGFTLQQGQLKATPGLAADVMIRGPFAAFAWLAAKKSDADSLFFNRQLSMEGDTELGLTIKNLLDATDIDALPAPLRHALDFVVARIPAQPPGAGFMPGSSNQ